MRELALMPRCRAPGGWRGAVWLGAWGRGTGTTARLESAGSWRILVMKLDQYG